MKSILLAILGILLGFLAGAFYSVSFDIGQWTEDCRLATLLVMAFCGVASCGLSAIK